MTILQTGGGMHIETLRFTALVLAGANFSHIFDLDRPGRFLAAFANFSDVIGGSNLRGPNIVNAVGGLLNYGDAITQIRIRGKNASSDVTVTAYITIFIAD